MRIKAAGKTQWGPTFTDKVPEILSRAYGPIVYAQIIRTPWNQTRGKILNCLIIVQFFANLLCQKCSRFRNAKMDFKSPRRTVKNPSMSHWNWDRKHTYCGLPFGSFKLKAKIDNTSFSKLRLGLVYMKVGHFHSLPFVVNSHLTKNAMRVK